MEQKDNRGFSATDLVTNKQYRAIIILVVYFFIFLALIMGIRNAESNEVENNGEQTEEKTLPSSKVNGFSPIKQANFNYKYTLNIDNTTYVYEGKKYNQNDSYTLTVGKTKKTYMSIDEFTFEIKNNEQVLADKPYYYIDFFDTNTLEKIIKKSIKKDNNVYSISNYNLDKILNNNLKIVDQQPNNILLNYENDIVTRIDIDYTNYAKYNSSNVKRVFLTLEYSDFGVIEEFNIKN